MTLKANISKEEYKRLQGIFLKIPKAPEGYTYKLKDVSYEWELAEIPKVITE